MDFVYSILVQKTIFIGRWSGYSVQEEAQIYLTHISSSPLNFQLCFRLSTTNSNLKYIRSKYF